MAKLHMNFNLPFDLPGLMHSIKDGLHELERHSDGLRSCETPDDLERKLQEVGAEFEERLKDTFGSFVDLTGMGIDPSVATNGRNLGIKVKETAEGWLLSASVPGVSHDKCAVTVEDDGEHSRLRVYVPVDPRAGDAQQQRRLIANYVKPTRLVDPGSVRASCIDGVLRVVVPKAPAVERDIPVSNDKPGAADEAAGEATMTLHVPGYAAADLSLALQLPAQRLVLNGRNDRMGAFPALDLALPRVPRGRGGDVRVSAFCRDGILTIRAAPPPAAAAAAAAAAPASRDVEVKADADPAGDDATVILEHPLPGLAAADVSVHVDAESRHVKVTADRAPGAVGFTRRRRGKATFLVRSLPRGVDIATVRASCADGLLRVTAAPPATTAERPVDVSADVPAHLGGGGGDAAAGSSE